MVDAVERERRRRPADPGAAQDASAGTPGKTTLAGAVGAGTPAIELPRLELRPGGSGRGDKPAAGPPQAIRKQRTKGGDAGPGAAPGEKRRDRAPAGGRTPRRPGQVGGGGRHRAPPRITHQTNARAPAGTPDTRTIVGVGEEVVFSSTVVGTWSATLFKAGAPGTGAGGSYVWTAPSTPGAAVISFDPGHGAPRVDTAMTVVAPQVEYRNARPVAFPGQAPGINGVDMQTDVFYTPGTVSFSNTYWWEQPGPASGVTGYFLTQTLPYHHPNPDDLRIDALNSGIYDTAGFFNFPPPWSVGFLEFVIPTLYKVTGESERHLITNIHQTCNIDANGTMTVQKGGSPPISRAP